MSGTVKAQLLLIVDNKVHDLGVEELPEDKHFDVQIKLTEVPCTCPEKEHGE